MIEALSKARAFLLRVNVSEGCFVSDTPKAKSRPYLFNEENSWKVCGYSEKWCKVLAARRIFSLNTKNIYTR
jgi:hypothetical protein